MVRFTASGDWVAKLDAARDLLSHRIPDGDVVEILDQALDLLIAKVTKERFAVLEKGSTPPARAPSTKAARTRRIPNAIKRAVHVPRGDPVVFTITLLRHGIACCARPSCARPRSTWLHHASLGRTLQKPGSLARYRASLRALVNTTG